jgi:hypothetical protein
MWFGVLYLTHSNSLNRHFLEKTQFLAKKCPHVWLFDLKRRFRFSPQFKTAGRKIKKKFYLCETDRELYMRALFGQKLGNSQEMHFTEVSQNQATPAGGQLSPA